MADLSAVLRKTIDGLPRPTPQLRAKVYDKARAAIQRQIEAANPPLADDVMAARQSALEDAIERTEAHYAGLEIAARSGDVGVPTVTAPPPGGMPAAGSTPPAGEAIRADRTGMAGGAPQGPVPAAKPFESDPARRPLKPSRDGDAPVFPSRVEEPEEATRPAAIGAPFIVPSKNDPAVERPVRDGGDDGLRLDNIPEADLVGPRYSTPRKSATRRGRAGPIAATIAAFALLGGAGALGWTYRDQIEALLAGPSGSGVGTLASSDRAATSPPGVVRQEAAGDDAAAGGTDVAALPSAEPPAASSPDGGEATPPAAQAPASTRQFTQRLLPDGTEVDEGPGASNANAFDEGTNIAAATPADAGQAPGAEPGSETLESTIGQDPVTVGEEPPPAAVPADPAAPPAAGGAPAEVAAIDPAAAGAAPAVAQEAVFYEERSETEAGTQQGGNVVWSVVNEPPSEGQPPEPAIRAVADVPEENLKLTMTIRRNADPTLPASHVIELMFDTPANFDGGGVANVQRLALKPTEQARGEPLIGVAGKISDGFFIIALNNLEQAIQSNLALMGEQEWIDIPLAYTSGRRALMSIEKGIPGERVFKEAMDAWAAKT